MTGLPWTEIAFVGIFQGIFSGQAASQRVQNAQRRVNAGLYILEALLCTGFFTKLLKSESGLVDNLAEAHQSRMVS